MAQNSKSSTDKGVSVDAIVSAEKQRVIDAWRELYYRDFITKKMSEHIKKKIHKMR